MIKYDYHIHSEFSGDSRENLENIVQKAMKLGLKEIAITDHLEYDILDLPSEWQIDLDRYVEKILKLKEENRDKINVKLGLEVGIQPHTKEYLENLISKYPFDFVIGSSHGIDRIDLAWGILQERFTKQEMQRYYFENVLKNVEIYDKFSVYGHLDFITRYGGEKFRGLNITENMDIIEEILKKLIHKGKGIEINTSGIRYKEDRFYPCTDILKRYKELGGEILTIGSDAHIKDNIALDFDGAESILEKLGIKYITTFENMKPVFKKI